MKNKILRVLSLILAAAAVFSFVSCKNTPPYGSIPEIPDIENPEKYADFELSREKLEYALSEALKKIDEKMMPTFVYDNEKGGYKYPAHSSVDNVYGTVYNDNGWNCGFWTGILWHAYQMTVETDPERAEAYMELALKQMPDYYTRIVEKLGVDHHDMGFVYSLSCVAAWKIDRNETAREAAILAADQLMTRYREKGEFIQAWGSMDKEDNYRLIVDCLMNIPLLFWATEETGDQKYREVALKHYATTMEVAFREDASAYHTYYFDPKTGEPTKGVTAQGVSNDSAWARGQAWAMYGVLLTYSYEENDDALKAFKATTNYYLNHLPKDYVAYWDLSFNDANGANEPRDSSSAAIALCAMLEGIKQMDENDPLRATYVNACKRIMNSLIDNYMATTIPDANGLLLHATYSKPGNNGVDEMNIWGDYFFMEALHRMLDPDWALYW